MEIDIEKFKRLLGYVFQSFKALETELLAYRVVFHAMTRSSPNLRVDEMFERARSSAQIQEVMNRKYDEPMERFQKIVDQAASDQELLKWFQDWKPQGPTN